MLVVRVCSGGKIYIIVNPNFLHCMHEINVAAKVWGGLPAQTAWRATEKATLKIDRESGLLSVRRKKPLL